MGSIRDEVDKARADAEAALNNPDWTGAEVDTTTTPRDVMIVVSARFPGDVAEALFAEAERRGVKPSALVRDLVERGLGATDDGDTMTVQIPRLRQEIEQAIRRAAA